MGVTSRVCSPDLKHGGSVILLAMGWHCAGGCFPCTDLLRVTLRGRTYYIINKETGTRAGETPGVRCLMHKRVDLSQSPSAHIKS